MINNKTIYTNQIKSEAKRLGFLSCGISKSGFLEQEAPRLERWLNQNHQGEMAYMANYFDQRLNPSLLVEGTKSVISLLLNYYPSATPEIDTYKIARYAYGQDYHQVIKSKLKALLEFIQAEIGEVNGRAFVDSAPVLDKAWAAKSGLGWIGKNSNLLTKQIGSYYFIAELLVDLELEYDAPTTDHCGNCTACIDACPTQAIIAPYVVDGSKCISYYTIELKNEIPIHSKGQWNDWIFGCDVCQEVCPWNRFSKPHSIAEFQPTENLLTLSKKEWEEITEETFGIITKNSPLKRAKWKGIKRNIDFLKND